MFVFSKSIFNATSGNRVFSKRLEGAIPQHYNARLRETTLSDVIRFSSMNSDEAEQIDQVYAEKSRLFVRTDVDIERKITVLLDQLGSIPNEQFRDRTEEGPLIKQLAKALDLNEDAPGMKIVEAFGAKITTPLERLRENFGVSLPHAYEDYLINDNHEAFASVLDLPGHHLNMESFAQQYDKTLLEPLLQIQSRLKQTLASMPQQPKNQAITTQSSDTNTPEQKSFIQHCWNIARNAAPEGYF